MMRNSSTGYKVRTLANLMQSECDLASIFDQIDKIVAAFPLLEHPGNDLGDDEKWQRVMLHSPANVFCLFAGEDRLVGYWSCFPVNDDLYEQGIDGQNINKSIDVDDINNFSVPGDYLFYFVDFFIYKQHTNPSSSRALFSSFSSFLEASARNGYFIKKIFAHTSSPDSMNLCRNAGFQCVIDHKFHVRRERDGEIRPTKIFEMDFSKGESNKILAHNSGLSMLYKKRYTPDLSIPFHPNNIKLLIKDGESDILEIKSTLRINLHTNQPDQKIELSALKSVAAFLNHSGGTLVIGVDDSGTPLGLSLDGFPSEDKMSLHLLNLIDSRIGREHRPYISPRFIDYEDERMLLVVCSPSSTPVFVKDNQISRFFVRGGNATVELSGSELTSFLRRRFS